MCLTSEAFDALSNAGKREYLDRVVAAKDAEIAKAKEERDTLQRLFDAAHQMCLEGDAGADAATFMRAALTQSWRVRDTALADLAAARAALDATKEQRDAAIEGRNKAIDHAERLQRALDGERGHADEARRCVIVHEGRETGTNVTAFAKWRRDYDARRAAEAKDHLTGVGKMVDGAKEGA